MQYQIPSVSKAHVNQGALVQQTSPIPVVAQPEMRGYAALHEGRYRQTAFVQVHQGPTVQQTSPVPEPYQNDRNGYWWSQQQNRFRADVVARLENSAVTPQSYIFPIAGPELSQFSALQRGRYFSSVTPRFEGATIQQTSPIPSTAQFDASRYLALQDSRYRGGAIYVDSTTAAQTVVGGGGAPTSPIPQPTQNDRNGYWWLLQQNRFRSDPVQRFENSAVVVAQTYVFPLAGPEVSQFLALQRGRYVNSAAPRFEGATVQAWFIYPNGQPEQSRFSTLQQNRYLVDARKYLDPQGTIIPQQYLFPVSQPEQTNHARVQQNRFVVDAARSCYGATIQQTYIFPLSQPVLGPPPQQPKQYLDFSGPTAQQSFVFSLIQPATAAARQQPKQYFDPFTASAATPQSYIFPVSQPIVGPSTQQPKQYLEFSGATSQQSFIFALSQPVARLVTQQPDLPKRVEGTAAPVPQLYQFNSVQPELSRFSAAAFRSRPEVGPIARHDGATRQQTYQFPVTGPELIAYAALYGRYFPVAPYIHGVSTTPLAAAPPQRTFIAGTPVSTRTWLAGTSALIRIFTAD